MIDGTEPPSLESSTSTRIKGSSNVANPQDKEHRVQEVEETGCRR
jgi:hypothetical protein